MINAIKQRWEKFSEWMRAWGEACDYSHVDYINERLNHLQKQIDELKVNQKQ
jgi:hypothetical protein